MSKWDYERASEHFDEVFEEITKDGLSFSKDQVERWNAAQAEFEDLTGWTPAEIGVEAHRRLGEKLS